jgi:hypothetical protein
MGEDRELAEQQGYLAHVEKASLAALRAANATLGFVLESELDVHVHDALAYAELFGSVAAQSWAAHYWRGAVHVNAGSRLGRTFPTLMRHEMTHAVLDAGRAAHRLPLWLNEGLAELVANGAPAELDPVRRLYLKDALRNDELRQLSSLDAFSLHLGFTEATLNAAMREWIADYDG